MTLEQELVKARKDVVTDGYDMSVGEVVSLYRDKELLINPDYQRYFRWDEGRKTRFIESILLGIPVPPIFVFQLGTGAWELVDGLQRVSTLLEFMGLLVDPDGETVEPLVLGGTHLLPSLAQHSWEKMPGTQALTQAQKIDIKRSRLRVEILKRESDENAKFELFQRLNTGGVPLSEQEVRNCTIVMIDRGFLEWMKKLAKQKSFRDTTGITEHQEEKQFGLELVLRMLAARNCAYTNGQDVHDYLDEAALDLVRRKSLNRTVEEEQFGETFELIYEALGDGAFRRWDGNRFVGKFLLSVFEVIAVGVSKNLARISKMAAPKRKAWLLERAKTLWVDTTFKKYSGAGVRGSDRLGNLLPLAQDYLRP